eukprot:gene19122-biopygen33410
MIDEATGISVTKRIAVCVRFLIADGRIVEHLLAFKALDEEQGASASAITELIEGVLKDLKIPKSDCFAFGADGASVMFGEHAGVQRWLKCTFNPHMQYTWYRGHLLNLACISAVDTSPRAGLQEA